MKLRLPNKLQQALLAAVSAVSFATLATGSAAYGEVTYNDLTRAFIDVENGVYYDGHGTFEVSSGNSTTLGITINVNELEAYQGSNDYTGFTPFVAWTFSTGTTDGIADVSTKNNKAQYAGLTGYYNNGQWSLSGGGQNTLTLETLKSYKDANGLVSMTVSNTLTRGVSLTLGTPGNTVTYQNTDLKFTTEAYQKASTTAYSVNRNYVTSVTLNTASTLDVSDRELPPDFSGAFHSDRWDAGDETSLGRVLFVGDSITHGIADQTWRWQIFKTFVDNGIENEIAGPLSGYDSKYVAGNATSDRGMSSYGGVEFVNEHLAQSSGRTHNIISGSNAGITGVNYSQWSTAKTAEYYNADTIICMMGTNDILSDSGTYIDKFGKLLGGTVSYDEATNHYTWTHTGEAGNWGEWGTMGTIAKDLIKQDGDTMYMMSIPTWAVRNDLQYGPNGNGSVETAHYGVQEYNAMLKQWTVSFSEATGKNVIYVDINRGLVDLTDTVSFKGYSGFFRPNGWQNDQLHPLEQGSLIIAGNLAQGMGLAGRTAGLARSAAGQADHGWQNAASSIAIANNQTVEAVTGTPFTAEGGYTIDFRATFGDGSANGWLDKANALSVSVGDGSNVGTLKLSEGYIMWGDTVIFCQDNHLTNNDALRVAYNQGNAEQNIGSGYYVWLGDMLIGQALTAGTGTLNGVTLSSAGGTGTVKGLTYTNTAYAPSTTLITSYDKGGAAPLPPMPDRNSTAVNITGLDFSNATTVSTGDSITSGQTATEALNVIRTGNSTSSYISIVSGNADHQADVAVNYHDFSTNSAVILATLNKSIRNNGNISVVMDGGTNINAYGHFGTGSGDYSFFGGYNATIEGTLSLEINDATLKGGIQMGHINNTGTIKGGVRVMVNEGATIGGDIIGGSSTNGTIQNGTAITITGGTVNGSIYGGNRAGGTIDGGTSILITGGTITGDVNGGSMNNSGTINGGTAVTVEGNKASIGGNITADNGGTVTLKDVATSGYSDGFDKYEGTITATNLVLDNYTAGLVNAKLVSDYVTAKNGTVATIHGLKLRNCSIDATGATAFTLGESVISGNTISYSGDIRLEDGTSFTITNPTTVQTGEEGFSGGKFIYQLKSGTEGSLLAADGSKLTAEHAATFTGTGDLEGLTFSYESYRGSLVAHAADATYNITTSTVDYSDISTAAGITMSGGQLNLDTALTSGTITATGGTVNIAEGVTLAQASLTANGATKLAGEGSYALTGGSQILPNNVSLDAQNWTGRVVLSGNVAAMRLDTNILATDNSYVEFNGVTGYFGNNSQYSTTIGSNVIIGEGGLSFNNGYSGYVTIFTGSLSGSGDIIRMDDGGARTDLTFKGDVSKYTGSFILDRNVTNDKPFLKPRFEGNASVINASFKTGVNAAGKMEVVFAANDTVVNGVIDNTLGKGTQEINLTAEQNITFNNTVSANLLSAGGKTVTLGTHGEGETATHGALNIAGAANIGTLQMGQGTTASFGGELTIGSLNLQGGNNVTLGASTTLNASAVTATGSTSTLSGAGTFVINSTLNNAGTTQNLPANLAFADEAWNGTVRVNGGEMNVGETIQALTQGDSWVELCGVSGRLGSTTKNTSTSYTGNVILTNTENGAPAFKITSSGSGTSATGHVTTLTGAIKGTGDIERCIPNGNTLTFDGNISEWTGTYYNGSADGTANPGWNVINFRNGETINANFANNAKTGGCYMTLNLAGNTTVNGILSKKTQEISVNVGDSVTFNNSADITTLNASGKTVTLGTNGSGETATHGALTVSGTATIGTLTMTNGSTANFTGAATHTIGTLQINTGGGTVTFGNNSTSTISNVFSNTDLSSRINVNAGSALTIEKTDANYGLQIGSTGEEKGIVLSRDGETTGILNITGDALKLTVTKGEESAYLFRTGMKNPGRPGLSLNYTLADSNFTIKNGDLVLSKNTATTLGNKLENTAVTNNGTETLTVNNANNTLTSVRAENGDVVVAQANSSAESLKSIKAEGGDVTLLNLGDTTKLSLSDLLIADSATVGAYTGASVNESQVASLTVSGTLTTETDSALNANLTLANGSTLVSNGALTMGCTLTFGNNLTLDSESEAYKALYALTESGSAVTLFDSVEGLTLGSDKLNAALNLNGYVQASDVFGNIADGPMNKYLLNYDDGAVTLSLNVVPEPATATLSLLALAGLAARRRRH